MAESNDLWGDLQIAQVRTPLIIMREQASLLGAKTKNLVEATVDTRVSGGSFAHSFNLVVPALGNYTYTLFTILHGPELYPIELVPRYGVELLNQDTFVSWLASQLSSPQTKRIVSNLLSQVAA